MTQDVLHVRDAVSKTFTLTPTHITVVSDFQRDELVVDEKHRPTLEAMVEFAYNRADECEESANGVMLDIHGERYEAQVGAPAQAIYAELMS